MGISKLVLVELSVGRGEVELLIARFSKFTADIAADKQKGENECGHKRRDTSLNKRNGVPGETSFGFSSDPERSLGSCSECKKDFPEFEVAILISLATFVAVISWVLVFECPAGGSRSTAGPAALAALILRSAAGTSSSAVSTSL